MLDVPQIKKQRQMDKILHRFGKSPASTAGNISASVQNTATENNLSVVRGQYTC